MKKKHIAIGLAAAALAGAGLAMTQRKKEIAESKPHAIDDLDNVLVLGSGGILGLAWHVATLKRLQAEGMWSPEHDHLRIGTSAGSIIALLLGEEMPLDAILDLALGSTIQYKGRQYALPELPTESILKGERSNKWYIFEALSKRHIPYLGVVLSSLAPRGDVHLKDLVRFMNALTNKKWPVVPTWITATSLISGRRHVFSSHSHVSPGFAVAASCAVPGLYEPLAHENESFADGGVISSLHLDLALSSGIKHITVLAPISGFIAFDRNDDKSQFLRKVMRNVQEVALQKAIIKAKMRGIDLRIIRPRPAEQAILNKNRLMDASLLPDLVRTTLS